MNLNVFINFNFSKYNKRLNEYFSYILGENIYQVTHNGKILEGQDNLNQHTGGTKPALNELDLFATELLGAQNLDSAESTSTNRSSLKLTINDVNANKDSRMVSFNPIDVKFDSSTLSDLIQDISFTDKEDNVKEDFFDFIQEDSNH